MKKFFTLIGGLTFSAVTFAAPASTAITGTFVTVQCSIISTQTQPPTQGVSMTNGTGITTFPNTTGCAAVLNTLFQAGYIEVTNSTLGGDSGGTNYLFAADGIAASVAANQNR